MHRIILGFFGPKCCPTQRRGEGAEAEFEEGEKMVLTEDVVDSSSIVAYLRRRSTAAQDSSIEDDFSGVGTGKILGKGGTGQVRMVKERRGEKGNWACKEMPLTGLSPGRLQLLRDEIEILR